MRDELGLDKLNYILDIARKMFQDLVDERKHIETKLSNFMYFWLAIVISMCTLFGKTISIYNEFVTSETYLLFFGFQFISIIRLSYLFFRVYHYDGNYFINDKIRTYREYDCEDETLENLMYADLDAQQDCIENNTHLNNKRNRDFTKLKKEFGYYLFLLAVLVFISFILN